MSIRLQTTETEFVEIEHKDWGLRWSIQFPEAIECAAGTIRAWPPIRPDWKRVSSSAWGYTWRPTVDYVKDVLALNLTTSDGRPQYSRLVTGAELRAQISTDGEQEVELSLTITNTGDELLRDVCSEGGCFQARSEAFQDGDEVARCHIFRDGAMTSMARLHRTNPIRCRYATESARDGKDFEWFWGRTDAVVQVPAVVGAVSCDGKRAVVIGYDQAREALQNADDHHCLHSGPWFGDVPPGQRVTRRGWILFGEDIHVLSRELTRRLTRELPALK